jgi:hypothetical protein
MYKEYVVPQNTGLTRESLDGFFERYYPEMVWRNVWTFWGKCVQLQKNPWVCASFIIKQKESQGKTVIKVSDSLSPWASMIGGFLVTYFIKGDFYDELQVNLKKYLINRYGYNEDEIVIQGSWSKKKWKNVLKNTFLYLGLYLLLFVIVSFIINIPDMNRPREFDEQRTEMFQLNDDATFTHKATGKRLPEGYYYGEEYNNHALITTDDNQLFIVQTDGELKPFGHYKDYEYCNASFLTPDIIWVRYNKYAYEESKDDFYDLSGNPTANLTVLSFQYKNSVLLHAFIALLLTVGIVFYFRSRNGKTSYLKVQDTVRKTIPDNDETILN